MSVARLIRPVTVTDAVLTASNVAEVPPAAYAAGTTYALAATAALFSGPGSTEGLIYESLQAGNIGHDPATSPLWWQPIGTAWLAYAGGTNYPLYAVVTDTAGHRLYKSLIAGNLGQPLSDVTKWQDIGPSPKWAMFDGTNGTQTKRHGSVAIEVQLAGRIDTIALLNIDASTARIEIETGAGVLHDQTYPLVETAGINNWFAWLFEPVNRKTDLILTGLPYAAGVTVRITLSFAGEARIGNCLLGMSRQLGPVEFGLELGITDRSRKVDDGFGNWSIVPRSYSKNQRFTAWIDNSAVDAVFNLLAAYRATPVLLIGAGRFASSGQYGLLKSWGISIAHAIESQLRIEFDGI